MGNFISTVIDNTIATFNPSAGRRRKADRMAMEHMDKSKFKQRGYEAAYRARRKAIGSLNTSSAREASRATRILAAEAQEICRNNPLAKRIKMIWANSIVGKGIIPEVILTNKNKHKRAVDVLEEWADSTDCDFDGNLNLSGLQWLMAAATVESGGVLIRLHINTSLLDKGKFPLQLQVLEQTYLDKSKNDGDKLIDGIQYSDSGQPEGYWVYSEESGLNITGQPQSIFYRKDEEMIHLYRKERPGQHLGVTWLAEVLTLLDKYNTLQEAVLMQQQIAACLGVIVRESGTPLGNEGQGTVDRPDEIYPNSINYLSSGSEVDVVQPPRASDQGQFIMSLKNDIAAGVNVTYPQLTGDYSKFNFASGRMGKNDFFETLDVAQNSMMKPVLKAIADKITLVMYLFNGIKIKINWAFPARTMVNPKEDFEYIVNRVRNGTLSPSGACRMLGVKLEDIIEQWKKDKATFGDLPFDIDPSKYSAAGNQLDENDAASSNNTGGDNA